MKKLPKFLKKYFWDVEFEKINIDKSQYFTLKRILDYGDEKAVSWMMKNFSKKEVREVLTKFRGISPKSANFWATIFNIDKKTVLCLQRHYLKKRSSFWPY